MVVSVEEGGFSVYVFSSGAGISITRTGPLPRDLAVKFTNCRFISQKTRNSAFPCAILIDRSDLIEHHLSQNIA